MKPTHEVDQWISQNIPQTRVYVKDLFVGFFYLNTYLYLLLAIITYYCLYLRFILQ